MRDRPPARHPGPALAVRRVERAQEGEAALALRHRVFCHEQGVPAWLDRDGRDDDALHLVAVEDDVVVGTCRLVVDDDIAKLGRLAVERVRRRRGAGSALLDAAEREARAAGARRIVLHAQSHAQSLYGAAGFVDHGPPFVEAGIEHVRMEKRLA